ncbi:MAG: ATP-binding cassette domain-containing protein [Clostridia bacterium]|nr:ATP-binding cassette domain-containing protein [Clostridia bacterium]
MSVQNETVVSIKDLILGVKEDSGNGTPFRFLIEYGTFDIKSGDFVLIKGRNGCGKSTFLRLFHLQGQKYFKVVSGSVCFYADGFPAVGIQDYSADELTHLNCAVAFIDQEDRFLSSDSAYSYIYNTCKIALDYNRALTAKQKKEMLKKVDAMILECYEKHLKDSFLCKSYKSFKNKNIRTWSGGQQKMISILAGIIKAKVCDLRLLVMDEPLNNLDGKNKSILNKLLSELRQGNIAVIAITHCQIFDGVNKVLRLAEGQDGVRRATLFERGEPSHKECLENYN